MREYLLNTAVCLAVLFSGCGAGAVTLDDMAITVTPEHPREYIFTDKGAAHLAGEAVVTPDRLVRRHRLSDGSVVTERVALFDRASGFQVAYDGVPTGEFRFVPHIDMRFLWKE